MTFPKLGVGCSAPFYGPLCDIPHLAGRTAVVTGANSGLGFETALALARAGARVALACRDQAKGGAALDRIRQAVPDADVRLDPLDLADLASVRKFAAGFSAEHDGLNILVNNAGVMAIPRRETADGFEMQFGTNHLGHFALTGLLLDRLLARPGARVVTVSSPAAMMGRIRFDDLQGRADMASGPRTARPSCPTSCLRSNWTGGRPTEASTSSASRPTPATRPPTSRPSARG